MLHSMLSASSEPGWTGVAQSRLQAGLCESVVCVSWGAHRVTAFAAKQTQLPFFKAS